MLALSKVLINYNGKEYPSQISSGTESRQSIGVVTANPAMSITIQPEQSNVSNLNELSKSLWQRDSIDFTSLLQEQTSTSESLEKQRAPLDE